MQGPINPMKLPALMQGFILLQQQRQALDKDEGSHGH